MVDVRAQKGDHPPKWESSRVDGGAQRSRRAGTMLCGPWAAPLRPMPARGSAGDLSAVAAFPLTVDEDTQAALFAQPAGLPRFGLFAGLDGTQPIGSLKAGVGLGAVSGADRLVAGGLGVGGHRLPVGVVAQHGTEVSTALAAGVALGVGGVRAAR